MIIMKTIFSVMLHASLASSVIVLLLLGIRKLFLVRLKPRFIYVLWFLVLIKLLIPVGPSSSISLFNLVPQATADKWTTVQSHPADHSESVIQSGDNGSSSPATLAPGNETKAPLPQRTEENLPSNLSTKQPEEPVSAGATSLPPTVQLRSNILKVGLWIWLGGLAVLGMYYLIVTLRFRKQLKHSRPIDNDEVLSVLKACSEQLGIKQIIPVYEISGFHSPCIYGVRKPRIYLPEDFAVIADSRQLAHVLLHELAHYKRKDLGFNSLWTLAVWLHWFNPFVWLARRKMASDREMACDAAVLELLGERGSSSYGMTLLMLSRLFSRSSSPRVHLSYFFNNKNETKRRVTMITKFKQGSYKLSAMAVVLILLLGAVLLTNAKVESNASSRAESPEEENPVAQFEVDRLIPSYKWFNNLNRAINFSKFEFKVPDYMPERYQLENINLSESFAKAHKADLINSVSITFVSNFGQKDEHYFEMVAAKGNGTLLEHNFLWGAPYVQALDHAPSDRQEDMTIGNINGVMYTTTKIWSKQKPETAKSFIWQDNGVMYTINFFSNDLSQDELAKVVQSFVSPGQVQHVDYKGEGNSFALYDETDLQEAKRILGFPVKIPVDVSDYGLKLSDISLMQADNQNTKFPFRPDTDVLWNSYRVPFNSPLYELNDSIEFYQSKAPVVDVKRLSFLRKLEMNGIGITAYADNDNIYTKPVHSDSNQLKFKTQTFYVWQQNGVYYTAHFYGVDKHQEENLNALVLAPVE